jgi:SAM-dependent methyltransferase
MCRMADSSLPEFWDTRYRGGTTPWDAGRVPDLLRVHVPGFPPGARVLVPGCGSGYEIYYLAENGFDVTGIDFSRSAVERARRNLGCFAQRVQEADFFAFGGAGDFDVIYERAFLCALPRKLWHAYALRAALLLKPGGLLAGFFFFDDHPRGPPFGTSEAELEGLLGPGFERRQDEAVADSIPVFQGKERWQVWRRR